MMLGNVPGVGAMSRIAQTGMKASGYLGDISDRAQGMINAFSTPGQQISMSENGQAGVTAFTGPASGGLGGYAAIDGYGKFSRFSRTRWNSKWHVTRGP